jgi:hypothetical protein
MGSLVGTLHLGYELDEATHAELDDEGVLIADNQR